MIKLYNDFLLTKKGSTGVEERDGFVVVTKGASPISSGTITHSENNELVGLTAYFFKKESFEVEIDGEMFVAVAQESLIATTD